MIQSLHALNAGDEQAAGRVHGDADVVVRPVGDHLGLGVDGGVEDRVLHQSHRGRLYHERQVRDLHLVLLNGKEEVQNCRGFDIRIMKFYIYIP